MDFFDTNILAYAVETGETKRNQIALEMLAEALDNHREYAISTQVMSEFSLVAIRKFGQSAADILRELAALKPLCKIGVDADMVMRAVEIQALYKIQFYDAQLIAAAERLGCARIFTEDLNDGESYCGIRVVNPFK